MLRDLERLVGRKSSGQVSQQSADSFRIVLASPRPRSRGHGPPRIFGFTGMRRVLRA